MMEKLKNQKFGDISLSLSCKEHTCIIACHFVIMAVCLLHSWQNFGHWD